MANIATYLQKALLDWVCGGATPNQPTQRWVGLSLGTPTSVSGSEVSSSSGYLRQTALFGAAASPAGSASNTAAMTFGPFSSSAAIQGLIILDSSNSAATSNQLWYGTLQTARTVLPGDQLVVGVGALVLTLS